MKEVAGIRVKGRHLEKLPKKISSTALVGESLFEIPASWLTSQIRRPHLPAPKRGGPPLKKITKNLFSLFVGN
jgi:hypothetical protein